MSQPVIKNFEAFKKYEGQIVRVVGTYQQVNVAKRPGRKSYIGRAKLVLEDGNAVVIESEDLGYRSDEEIAKCEGMQVAVVGRIKDWVTLWGGGMMASIVAPCVQEIVSLELVEEK